MTDEEQAIRGVIREMLEAFNEQDPRRSALAFAPDGELATVGGEWFRGASQIEKGLARIFATRAGNARLRNLESTVRIIRPDVALAHVKNELSGLVDADGRTLPPHVEFSLRVLVKDGGKWRVAAMHNRRWA